MTRSLSRRPSLPSAPQRHVLLQFETWIAIVTLWGMVVNEWIGPAFLGLALLLWAIRCLQYPGVMVRSLGGFGVIPWLMPLLALLSVLWSADPALTSRTAIQLCVTVALAFMTASLISPRRFIASLWAVMGLILVLSLIQNNQHYDGMTGRVTMAGVFSNKNTLGICSAIFALASASICANRGYPAWLRMVSLPGIGIGIVICILARSIGVIMTMFLAIGLLSIVVSARLLPQRLRTNYAEMAFLGSLFGGVVLLVGMLAFRDELLALVGKDSTLTGRTVLWFYADHMSQDHPVLGVGYNAFWLRDSAPAEFLWKKLHVKGRGGFHFHSLYYETLIQLGYVGVVTGLFVILRGMAVVVRWTCRSPDACSGFCIALALMLLAGQWQASGLFGQFEINGFFFMTSVAYAANWHRLQAGSRRLQAVQAHPPAGQFIPGTA